MSTSSVTFHEEHPEFRLENKEKIRKWLLTVAEEENSIISQLSYIFLSDDELLEVNKEYLGHNYYTDIITFPLHDNDDAIEADVYISIDRVQDNAEEYEVDFEEELLRVIVHGLLHLCGYNDESDVEKSEMSNKEDEYISIFSA